MHNNLDYHKINLYIDIHCIYNKFSPDYIIILTIICIMSCINSTLHLFYILALIVSYISIGRSNK